MIERKKPPKDRIPRKFKWKVIYQMDKSKAQNIKPIENSCHVSDLLQTCHYFENG